MFIDIVIVKYQSKMVKKIKTININRNFASNKYHGVNR